MTLKWRCYVNDPRRNTRAENRAAGAQHIATSQHATGTGRLWKKACTANIQELCSFISKQNSVEPPQLSVSSQWSNEPGSLIVFPMRMAHPAPGKCLAICPWGHQVHTDQKKSITYCRETRETKHKWKPRHLSQTYSSTSFPGTLRGGRAPQIIKEEALRFGKNAAVSDSLAADGLHFWL